MDYYRPPKATYYIKTSFYVELYYGEFPSDKIRSRLNVCGWKWNRSKKCWYANNDEENIRIAEKFCEQMNIQVDPVKNFLSKQSLLVI